MLIDILKKYDFNTIFTELSDIFPEINRKRPLIKDAYDFLLSQTPVSSKKRIIYKLIEDDESFDCFVGAEDHQFEANWNVIIGKEVVREDNIEISDLEIATNSFLCILLIGFAPKRFKELQDELRQSAY